MSRQCPKHKVNGRNEMLIKWNRIGLAAAILTVVSSVGVGTVWSYMKTAHAQLGANIRDAVPIAFELKRLEQLTAELIPEIQANQQILNTRRQTLLAATEKIHQYQHQRLLLVEKADSLQAELKLVELAQSAGTISFDGSKLQQAKDLAQTVEKRIRTVHKLVEGERLDHDISIPVEADPRPAAERFDEYFAAANGKQK
jgi:hypothetical protein